MSENGELTPQFALLLGKMMVNQWTYIGAAYFRLHLFRETKVCKLFIH